MDNKPIDHCIWRLAPAARVAVVLLALLAILGVLPVSSRVAAQPQLPGDWDGMSVRKPSVLREGGAYRMWYDGNDIHDYTRIGLAISTDGISWEKYAGNPVLSGDPEAWDSTGEHAPFILKDRGLYKMWYEGSDGALRQLGYATSPDGITWSKAAGNPVLRAGPQGYDQDVAGHGSVLYDGGLYKLWYHAIGDQGIIIAYATSVDGINWVKQGPVLLGAVGEWDEFLWGPSVLKVGGTYRMWYSASSPGGTPSIGLATSPDGVVWTRSGNAPVIARGDEHLGDPHVIYERGIYKIWFNNFSDGAIYYAESVDGFHWSDPVLALGHGLIMPLEGWHDGMEGQVSGEACTAFGWAVDPEDRDRDVQVRILSDGAEVATFTASEYGEDMEQYGICPEGTCRFTQDLSGLISPDEEHQITVQAYDEESGDWWNLEGTPKSLTCLAPAPPNPRFTVFPEWEFFDGLDWPDGATVSISVETKQECSLERESWDGFFNGNFPEGCDIVIGDMVTFTDGETIRTHTVQNLAITEVNKGNDTISGNADKGAVIYVWPHDGWFEPLQAVAGTEGAWQVDLSSVGYDIVEGKSGRSEIRDEVGNSTAVDWSIPLPLWRDEFDAEQLDPAWYWLNENPGAWELSEGYLRINASPYRTGEENLLLRPVSHGDFAIKTRLLFEPDTNFQYAGLVIYQDDSNFLQLGRAFCDLDGLCAGDGFYFDYVQDGQFTGHNFAIPMDGAGEVSLRLEKRGDMVRAFYSYDGFTWYEMGEHWVPPGFQVNGVGLTASQNYSAPDQDVPAYFDFFELTDGWGFLPEGYHDHDQGDVPSWACNAGGWAADPDDRAARLNVEIVVDHTTVAQLLAADFRQDLLDSGTCVDGECGFFVPLWGSISPYEFHRVDIWAQDDPSGEWVLLRNSAKPLTCRTYDIYAFDPLTGETEQITNLRDADEYNPSWAPNGKKVAHDVVNSDGSQAGIYITDVKSGSSTPLQGAGPGSNDAVWSPNGKWIVFDRAWDENPCLYILPSTGGVAALVREDAISPDWAPSGKRLVFQQLSDGSIRTVPVDGGKGNETLVSPNGANPAWSPDGNWIAYEMDGDIWKVQVNALGVVSSAPIRLAGGPYGEGQAAWSPDSQTVVFHSGPERDYDLWSVPAAGGEAIWLTGAYGFGDYDPAYDKKSANITYASFSPEGQAARWWVSAYTYDLPPGAWEAGPHTYHFQAEWNGGSELTDDVSFNVVEGPTAYHGFALLRPHAVLYGSNGDCPQTGTIPSGQWTRFLSGYATGGEMSYSDSLAFFDSVLARVIWDGGTAELSRNQILPFYWEEWFQYVCTFTAGPPKMELRVNYGHDWVESFYEAGHEVLITVTDGEGIEKASAIVHTMHRDEWGGKSLFQTVPEDWYPAAPDLQPGDWIYAVVDNGVTAEVQLGDIQGEVRFDLDKITGTILVPWISDPVFVECLDWGSGGGPFNKEVGFIIPDGEEVYSCSWDPETEWDVQPWQDIGVGYFTPDGNWVANAFLDERWMAMWTHDPLVGFLAEGEHEYTFEWAYTVPWNDSKIMDQRSLTVSSDAPTYPGYVLVQPWAWMPQQAWTGSACEPVESVNLGQPMRFIWGWVNDFSMTYDEALAHFGSFTVEVYWDGATGGPAELEMGELLPFTGLDDRWEYLCTFTEHP